MPCMLLLLGLALAGDARRKYARAHRSFLHSDAKQPVEQLEQYQDGGLAAPAKALDSTVSADEYAAALQGVVGSGESRFVFAPSMPQVKKYLEGQLGSDVAEQPFPVQAAGKRGDGFNLVHQLQGESNSFYVVGAHYDTVPATGPAPGAEDNGSGTAALLTIAKHLHTAGKPKHSVYFVLFSAEEEGLVGSKAFAASLVKEGKDKQFLGAVIMDEVAFTRTDKESVIFETSGRNPKNQALMDTLAAASGRVAPHVDFQVNYAGFGSDHMPFLERGMPAVLVIERDNLFYADNYAHTAKDVLANTKPSFGADIASLVGQAVWDLANV